MHLVRREPWATIDLDVTNGHVFVRQDWCYEWSAPEGIPPWTLEEKQAYHRAVDHLIWGHWSMRASIRVSRKEIRAARTPSRSPLDDLPQRRLSLSFDVRRVSGLTQWRARVAKVDPIKDNPKLNPDRKGWPEALCWFDRRELQLYDISIAPHNAMRYGDATRYPGFYVVPHEFGHTLGYANGQAPKDASRKGDEYFKSERHYNDTKSIMNVGRRTRDRHLFLIVRTLGRMVPTCTFTASVPR